ncbi:PepSY domain-containing protein [Heyndrickxia sporothermodurans]
MRKIRRLHFWIGVIISIFLLFESISGIYLYFQEQGREGRQFPPQGQMGAISQQQGMNPPDGSNTVQNGSENFGNRQAEGFNQGNNRINMDRNSNSLGMNLRKLHSGIIGLMAGIGMLILTATGLVLSVIIGRANRKRRKKESAAI